MERREFFKVGARKAAGMVFELTRESTAPRSVNWLRPPFAVKELNFLLGCTRCNKCIEACDYEVLFKLPSNHSRQVAGTPAMDLLSRGCRMCADWPCVEACEPNVMRFPDDDEACTSKPLKLARVAINSKTCLPYLGPECGACASACPVPGALEWVDGLRPVINDEVCTGCALCREPCIVEPKAIEVSVLIPDDEAMAEAT